MAYSTGTAVDLDGLFDALEIFVAANGWTVDRAWDDGTKGSQPAFHKNSCYVSWRYDNSTIHADGVSVAMFQALGYNAANNNGNHADDSGSGYYSAAIPADSTTDNSRCLYRFGDGPFTYWFFERDDGGSGVYYVHVVVEIRQGQFSHFGFGKIDKYGDWGSGASGGEYVYGHRNEGGYVVGDSSFGLDAGSISANAEGVDSAATMHIEGYVNQELSKWASVWGYTTAKYTSNLDRAGVQRSTIMGSGRYGPLTRAQGFFTGYPGFTGVIPMTAQHCWFLDFSTTPFRIRLLGTQADMRFLSIANFDPGEEVTIGSDTWVFFPIIKKGTAGGSIPSSDSFYAGFAYRKDVT